MRDVDTVFAEVDGDVLPEVRQLQGCADGIGKFGELLFAMTVEKKDEPADRIQESTALRRRYDRRGVRR